MNTRVTIEFEIMQYVMVLLAISVTALPFISNTLYKANVIIICLFASLYWLANNSCKIRINSIAIAFGLFSLWCWASGGWSVNQFELNVAIAVLFNLFFICTTGIFLTEKKCIGSFFNGYVIGTILLAIYVIAKAGFGAIATNRRLPSEVINSNELGIEIALSFAICMYFYSNKKSARYMIVMLFLIPICLITGSRSAFLFVVVFCGVYFASLGNINLQTKIKILICLIFAALLLLIVIFNIEFFYNIIGYRIEETFYMLLGKKVDSMNDVNSSNYLRNKLMQESWDVFVTHPVLGVGINNFKDFSINNLYAHSNYLELLADVGIIGFSFYYSFILIILLTSKNARKSMSERAFVSAICISILSTSFFCVFYNKIEVNSLLAVLFYMASAMKEG